MKIQSFLEAKQREYVKKKKHLKRQIFFLKAKLFFVFVLPVVIILLAVKTLKIFLQIKLRNAVSQPSDSHRQEEHREERPAKQPVSLSSFKPEFITPEPVKD